MYLQLGRVAVKRDRARDATRLLGQAIQTAGRLEDRRTEAEAHLELGVLRKKDGDLAGAATTVRRACELLGADSTGSDAALANAATLLADLLVDLGDTEQAGEHLFVAHARAKAAGSLALIARVTRVRARLKHLSGQTDAAHTLMLEASELAATAGDAESATKFADAG